MIFLALAVGLFAIIHLIPAFPALKDSMKKRYGAAWGPGFSLAAIVSLALIVIAWQHAPYQDIYQPPSWGPVANLAALFLAFQFLAIFLFRGTLRHRFRFPLAIAVIFWAAGHLAVNGDLASIILFSGLGLYGVIHLIAGLVHNIRPAGNPREGHDIISLLAGAALFIVMVQLHPVVIGKPILDLPALNAG